MKEYYDEETNIVTRYDFWIKEVKFNYSTVWLNVERRRYYRTFFDVDVRFHVEFANSEDCTRFLHYDMRELEDRVIYPNSSDVGVIDVIIRALDPIHVDYYSAEMNAQQQHWRDEQCQHPSYI
ncbi:hypothetical protein AB1N83_013595 [Pleurotus pulmonarius]